MDINFIAVGVSAVAQFIVGAIWYMPLFGKMWGQIHGFDKVPPEQQKEMYKSMMPLMLVQFVMALVTSFVFGILVATAPAEWHAYGLAGHLWLGFAAPMQVSLVIFGGTEPKWVVKKTLIAIGGSLVCFMAMAAVFSVM
ncbi:MAG: hypothetical protein RLZZ283_502 [Candidatus Parcubacteria bacterium]|jgi:hypothetical protein